MPLSSSIKCDCGGSKNFKNHNSTKKHQKWLKNKKNEEEIIREQAEIIREQAEIIREQDKKQTIEDFENPNTILQNIIEEQTQKEKKNNIWQNSPFSELPKLQINNVGNVGENFSSTMCEKNKIPSKINGSATKTKGGGNGDGSIKDRTVEVKTSHLGINKTFQHELGEHPWKSDYLIFVDVAPKKIYLTILKNFSENHYNSNFKCHPYFPTKQITRRKKSGNFKFDTSINLYKKSTATLEITSSTSIIVL